MSPFATHRDHSTFGPDADIWRPERWLEGDEHTKRKMENALLTFGAGNRSCIGKHISYLEISKLVPSLVGGYEISFADVDGKDWKVENRWFTKQTGLNVKLQKRNKQPPKP
ncbi:MAG: hypothetical protein L6R38_008716 [Xanthoria sp. 2 TBL-2021]|nr:MAG: hypothetical protein L6R38_008716 [Xanthoria sp. 2 TBL-2021]